jgi:putative membrane protein
MDESIASRRSFALSDYLAAERTFMAWMRTGIALMGFGFVVARFGLFLQEFQAAEHSSFLRPYGPSLWFGTALIAGGVVVNLASAWHHARLIRSMDRGEALRSDSRNLAFATCLFLAVVGLGMAIYLISVRDPAHARSQNGEDSSMALIGTTRFPA